MKPALLVIAGPNGGGKTTVTTRLRCVPESVDAATDEVIPIVADTAEDGVVRHPEHRAGRGMLASRGLAHPASSVMVMPAPATVHVPAATVSRQAQVASVPVHDEGSGRH